MDVDVHGELHREVYTHGYSPQVAAYMAARTATREAGFLLPHLHTGMRVLDCGCGPGSITMDLAWIVAPGLVEGIDIGETQIASAEAGALERGLSNVHFQVGTVYELPFPDGSFDVVFASAVMQHLSDPLRALREMRRVLAPGGIAALRDEDWAATLLGPTTPVARALAFAHDQDLDAQWWRSVPRPKAPSAPQSSWLRADARVFLNRVIRLPGRNLPGQRDHG